MVSVSLETSFLGVRDGRVRGCMWSSSPRVPYGTGVVQVWRFLSSVSEMCVGVERLVSWRSQGVFCVNFSACSGFACSLFL